jgi:tetratricopeptide (TPR) repeat protein
MAPRSFLLLFLAAALTAAPFDPRPELDAGRYLKVLAQAEAELRTEPRNAVALAAKAQALTALVRLPEALQAARQAVALQPALPEALLARAMATAGLALQRKSWSSISGVNGAMDDLNAAVLADPRFVPGWMTLGIAYETLPGLILGGSTKKALACAETLKKLDPVKGSVLYGTILSMERRWPEAQGAFSTALARAPGDPNVVYAYLDALGSRETRKAIGEAEQKRRLVQEARRLLPGVKGHARAVCAVCDALVDGGQGEEAWTVATAALAQTDAPSLLRLQLGKLAARTGLHREQGLASLDQVIREPLEGGSGGYGSAHWRRGQILKDLGRLAEARAAAQAALALDPNDSKAKGLLDGLE